MIVNCTVKKQESNDCTISTSGTNTAISASEMDTDQFRTILNGCTNPISVILISVSNPAISYWYRTGTAQLGKGTSIN